MKQLTDSDEQCEESIFLHIVTIITAAAIAWFALFC